MPTYLDCNATTPLEPRVGQLVSRYLSEEYGNAGSRSHEFGAVAKQAVERARSEVAQVVSANPAEITFTSGATESNNLALLGLEEFGKSENRRHIITTPIEHKAVLEPLEHLGKRGFEVEYVPVGPSGRVRPKDVADRLRPDTLLVSVMHVNNETGIIQPVAEIADALADHPAFFHTDAAQGFGKEIEALQHPRIDLISISAHKVYGPKGTGALLTRRRGYSRPPLKPLMFGGGQERALRPGTHAVPLIAGLGLAASLAREEHADRREKCLQVRAQALTALSTLDPILVGDQDHCVPHTLSLVIPGLDSEAVMLALKHVAAISNGSACTSQNYEPSHVITSMGLPSEQVGQVLRLSWCHLTPDVDWSGVAEHISGVRWTANPQSSEA